MNYGQNKNHIKHIEYVINDFKGVAFLSIHQCL